LPTYTRENDGTRTTVEKERERAARGTYRGGRGRGWGVGGAAEWPGKRARVSGSSALSENARTAAGERERE